MFEGPRLRIADMVLGFDSPFPGFLEGSWGSFDVFRVLDIPDIRIVVRPGPAPEISEEKRIFSTDYAWALSKVGQKWVISSLRGKSEGVAWLNIFDTSFANGEIYVGEGNSCRSFVSCYPMGQLMLLMINLLNQGHGVLFHGCGIKVEGKGLLFAGVSGAGKTTTANLWKDIPGVTVLSDDRVIVRRREDGRFWLYGTPWHGDAKAASPESAPLDKVFVLNHALANEITSLSPATAIGQLIRCASPAFWSPTGVDFTLQFLESMVQELPTFRYDFVPDPSAVEYIQSL